MGVLKQVLDIMLHEHSYQPITGELLSIGKQTVNVTENDIDTLFKKYGICESNFHRLLSAQNKDIKTRHNRAFVSDETLYRSFCSAHYQCLDISDYEGANIIHDMNTPIPKHYHQSFDFIFNGSCMDNLFDPVTFLKNTSKVLKPGGRILHLEAMANVTGAFLQFSPEWFFSYYAINNFKDCKVYVFRVDEAESRFHFDSDLFAWTPYFTREDNYDYLSAAKAINGYMYLLIIAEKDQNSTSERVPQQMQYLHEGSVDWRKQFQSFSQSGRPKLSTTNKKHHVSIPFETDHFEYLGSKF